MSWTEKDIFRQANGYNFSGSYASHLWNHVNNDLLTELTPEYALKSNSTFARICGKSARLAESLVSEQACLNKNCTKMLTNT